MFQEHGNQWKQLNFILNYTYEAPLQDPQRTKHEWARYIMSSIFIRSNLPDSRYVCLPAAVLWRFAWAILRHIVTSYIETSSRWFKRTHLLRICWLLNVLHNRQGEARAKRKYESCHRTHFLCASVLWVIHKVPLCVRWMLMNFGISNGIVCLILPSASRQNIVA